MAELEIQLHVIELVLNHSTRQLSGVAGVYNRHQYLQEKRGALQVWADHVGKLVEEGKASEQEGDKTSIETTRG